jgi:hypothetical protein
MGQQGARGGPPWLARSNPIAPTFPWSTGRHAGGIQRDQLITKRVCKICNEGWLEQRLEHPCQPILDPMLRGREATLGLPAQSVLAAWIAKTAMEYRYAESPPLAVEPEWLKRLYEQQLAPDSWYIWVASYRGDRPVFAQHDDITMSFPDTAVSTPHGVLLTLVVGYVAFKVVGINVGTPSYPGADHLLRLWPPGNETVIWPPERHLDDATLPGFAHMFLDKPGEAPPPLPE